MSGNDVICLDKKCLFIIMHSLAKVVFWLSIIVFTCSVFGWFVELCSPSSHEYRYGYERAESLHALTFLILSLQTFFGAIILDGFAYIVEAAIKYLGEDEDVKPQVEEKKEPTEPKDINFRATPKHLGM